MVFDYYVSFGESGLRVRGSTAVDAIRRLATELDGLAVETSFDPHKDCATGTIRSGHGSASVESFRYFAPGG